MIIKNCIIVLILIIIIILTSVCVKGEKSGTVTIITTTLSEASPPVNKYTFIEAARSVLQETKEKYPDAKIILVLPGTSGSCSNLDETGRGVDWLFDIYSESQKTICLYDIDKSTLHGCYDVNKEDAPGLIIDLDQIIDSDRVFSIVMANGGREFLEKYPDRSAGSQMYIDEGKLTYWVHLVPESERDRMMFFIDAFDGTLIIKTGGHFGEVKEFDWCLDFKELMDLEFAEKRREEILAKMKTPMYPGSCFASNEEFGEILLSVEKASCKQVYDFYVEKFNKQGGANIMDNPPYSVFIKSSNDLSAVQILKDPEKGELSKTPGCSYGLYSFE